MQIAAEHSEAVGQRARVGVEEWLLFDGIALHSANIAPGNIQSAALVVADLADSGLTFGNRTAMAAGVTTNPIAIQFFVEITFTNVLINDVAKSGHGNLCLHSKPGCATKACRGETGSG